MKKIDDPLQNDFGTLSQKTGLNALGIKVKVQKIFGIWYRPQLFKAKEPAFTLAIAKNPTGSDNQSPQCFRDKGERSVKVVWNTGLSNAWSCSHSFW